MDREIEEVPFTFLPNTDRVRDVLAASPDLPYSRLTFDEDGIGHRDSTRPTVIQTQMAFGGVGPDEFHPGCCLVEARFFLPSGCYATAAVRQLFGHEDLTRRE